MRWDFGRSLGASCSSAIPGAIIYGQRILIDGGITLPWWGPSRARECPVPHSARRLLRIISSIYEQRPQLSSPNVQAIYCLVFCCETTRDGSQAGQSVRCACGSQLVGAPRCAGCANWPPADDCRTFERAGTIAIARRSGLCAGTYRTGVAGVPPLLVAASATFASDQHIEDAIDKGSTGEIYATYPGLQKESPPLTDCADPYIR